METLQLIQVLGDVEKQNALVNLGVITRNDEEVIQLFEKILEESDLDTPQRDAINSMQPFGILTTRNCCATKMGCSPDMWTELFNGSLRSIEEQYGPLANIALPDKAPLILPTKKPLRAVGASTPLNPKQFELASKIPIGDSKLAVSYADLFDLIYLGQSSDDKYLKRTLVGDVNRMRRALGKSCKLQTVQKGDRTHFYWPED